MSNGEEQYTVADGSDHAAPVIKAEARVPFNESGVFACKNCGDSGEAQGMYNLPCNPLKTSRAKLTELIRCERCATEISKRNQRQLGEPGCGVYYLRVTIAKLRPESEIEAEENRPKKATPQEIQEKRDLETLQWVLESKQRRDEAVRQERVRAEKEERLNQVRAYAVRFAEDTFDETVGLPLPSVRRWDHLFDSSSTDTVPSPEDRMSMLYCGLPSHISCCTRSEPSERFLAFRGETIGICAESSRIFLEVHASSKDDPRYKKLLWFRERDRAEEAVAKFNRAAEEAEKGAQRRRR